MGHPAKRRRLESILQIPMVGKDRRMGDSALIQDPTFGNKDALDKELLHVAISDIPKAALPSPRRSSLLASSQGKHKLQRLHPRNFVSHRGVDDVANPVIQPVQTTVASFINVVLDQGGTSVGNVLVPAESTVFNVNGYGPVTLNNAPPAGPTPSPQDQNTSSGLPPASSNSQDGSSVPQQTTRPTPGPLPQAQPTATAAQGAPAQQSPMSIQVSGSSSQVILSSPPTPLPPNPSNSTTSATGNESYFGFSSSGVTSTSRTSTEPSTALSQSATTSPSPQMTSGGVGPPRGNLTTSVTPSQTSSGRGIGGPTGTAGGAPASTTTAAAGSGDGDAAPTPTIVGSVVGSVAGLALILVLLLIFLRRRKRLGQQRTISPPIPQSASTGPGASTGTMTERSSAAIPLAGAGAGAGFFRRLRPGSGATATTTETTPSERGFQNLGGRKLPSVLSSRGDGFGDLPFGAAGTGATPGSSSSRGPPPPSIPIITGAPSAAPGPSSPESLDGSSFYRDSQGFYGGPAPAPSATEPPSTSSSMFVGPGSPPHSPALPPPEIQLPPSEGVAVMRPGPARTPVTTQPGLSPLRGSPRLQRGPGPPSPHIPGTIQERPRDGLGRSHPSSDGSRSSRFAEDI
ncbi:MAG: hypothetical protein LQ344_002833 [Seirophora lacunosa]|nr:MAG: hypothetical protein LQ344_002833 [Seirophora lacunosa]